MKMFKTYEATFSLPTDDRQIIYSEYFDDSSLIQESVDEKEKYGAEYVKRGSLTFEDKVRQLYPDSELYRFVNKRGAGIVIRNTKSEEIWNWHNMIKIE